MSQNPDVVVIGAGIVGVCCALYLQRAGLSVSVVDPAEPGERCSFGNSGSFGVGLIAPAGLPGMARRIPLLLLDPYQPLFVDWMHVPRLLPWLQRFLHSCQPQNVEAIAAARASLLGRALDAYRPLFDMAGVRDMIRPAGMMFVYESEQTLEKSAFVFGLARKHGVVIEEMSGDEARRLNPALGSSVVRAVLFPANAHTVNPSRLVKELARAFQTRGGVFERARALRLEGGPIVVTDRGTLTPRFVVVAAGVWSKDLAAKLGVRVLMEAERGYHAMLHSPGIELPMPTTLSDRNVVLTPMEHGLRVTGIAEFASPDKPPVRGRAEVLIEQARHCFPTLDAARYDTWMGPRPSTPDSLPVISACPDHPSILFAFGHGQAGLAMAAITGKLISEMALKNPTSIDIGPFAVSRFA